MRTSSDFAHTKKSAKKNSLVRPGRRGVVRGGGVKGTHLWPWLPDATALLVLFPCLDQALRRGSLSWKSCTRLTDSIRTPRSAAPFAWAAPPWRPETPTSKPACCNDVTVCYLRNLNLSRRQHRARSNIWEEKKGESIKWVTFAAGCCLLASRPPASLRVHYVCKGCFWTLPESMLSPWVRRAVSLTIGAAFIVWWRPRAHCSPLCDLKNSLSDENWYVAFAVESKNYVLIPHEIKFFICA